MEKFISYEKLSKKKQRELDENAREFWEYTKPYTRVLRDKKKYYRKKSTLARQMPMRKFIVYYVDGTKDIVFADNVYVRDDCQGNIVFYNTADENTSSIHDVAELIDSKYVLAIKADDSKVICEFFWNRRD